MIFLHKGTFQSIYRWMDIFPSHKSFFNDGISKRNCILQELFFAISEIDLLINHQCKEVIKVRYWACHQFEFAEEEHSQIVMKLFIGIFFCDNFEVWIVNDRMNLIFDKRLFHSLQNIMDNFCDIGRFFVKNISNLEHSQKDCISH
jgi:hypothetical protein